MTPRYSLVIPLYNEAGNVLPLLEESIAVLGTLSGSYEIVLVNDGSTDETPAEIQTAIARWPQVRALSHPGNRGQAAALLAGLQSARGEIIFTMDGDGQNDPRDFPRLLSHVESGRLDVACGWRVDRHDSAVRRILSRIGNAVRRRILRDGVHDSGCQLRVMRRTIVDHLFPLDLMQSFVPAIACAAGLRVGEFPVRHRPRLRGRAKFGLRQLWLRPALALLKCRRQLKTTRSYHR